MFLCVSVYKGIRNCIVNV